MSTIDAEAEIAKIEQQRVAQEAADSAAELRYTSRPHAQEVDEALAAVYNEVYATEDRLATQRTDVARMAGAKFYYRGKRRVTDMTHEEAAHTLRGELAKLDEHEATHEGESKWVGYVGQLMPYDRDSARRALAKLDEHEDRLEDLHVRAAELEKRYTGWSRFFLVTSSAGHIHSSTSCSTCRPTTRYGWLPELSGRKQEQAVDELGPTLCSVCFPSAPTDWTEGKKITAAQAARKAA